MQSALGGGVSRRDWWHFLLLLMVGAFCSLLPDIPAVWNYFLYDNLEHGMAGPIPTHSLVFGTVAFCGAFIVGLLAYRHRDRALALGMFAETAFLSHLLLDDIAEGGLTYLYPLHNEPLSLFSYVNVEFSGVNFLYYNLAGIVSVFFIFCVLLMSLMSLHYLGFGFRYHPLQNGSGTNSGHSSVRSRCVSRGIQTSDANAVENIR
ncbi:metal-dependent hydrolase [uncultured Methanomethylovorans sp.]|uniref:metal-dependent hydrolase n=1 Tax=uncultured Methanomethylovorans sp. TaxID=183759 RepID=UPI0026174B1C|nr:metal-dependent hydrolase [uncultured Methanomethylovorans sp.]